MSCLFVTLEFLSLEHLLLILLIIVVLFGGKKIPDLMKGLGEGIREFKKASQVPEGKKKEPEPEPKALEKEEENK
ncbi:MAG: twin-arginine translocase TatA/TatE family subunit [Bacteroidota bacterium]|nr:twin-arginine translocase TatA/TatE family subunit [Bacteroidota bacterium]MDP4226645.1 twin-arginine translocase TatA/TatE family subunit [Bacteroidota bacterium]MDP4274818.1 twin-arginine translocase TatA/TatE family subunit [Bacteroidota bacterium]